MHALGGLVALAGSDKNVYQLKEGMDSLPKALIRESGANLNLESDIQDISLRIKTSWSGETKKTFILKGKKNPSQIFEEEFDAVFIACPLVDSEKNFFFFFFNDRIGFFFSPFEKKNFLIFFLLQK